MVYNITSETTIEMLISDMTFSFPNLIDGLIKVCDQTSAQ